MSNRSLWLIILIEGFVTISAEILTIRQLLPIVGNSVIVTSLIIGVFLLFLAYGYRRGGQYKDHYIIVLKRNFTFSAFWLGIGLSYIFIFIFFSSFDTKFYAQFSNQILIALTAYLLLITAPLVYILGQTVPITMNLFRHSQTVGGTGGKILHLSTIGSFLGAVFTSLILMQFLGVAWTILINYCFLMFLTLLLITHKKKDILRIVLLVMGLALTYAFNVFVEKKLFVATNAYANYQIADEEKGKMLYVNESASSLLDAKKRGFSYIELIKRILFTDLKLENKEILVLGAGGFSLSAENTHGNRFTYLDIDPALERIVKEHFINPLPGKMRVKDARAFLNTTPLRFDVIVSDVYSHNRSIPAHLLTHEYFGAVNTVLNDQGMAVFNIIAKPSLDDPYSKRVDNTIRSVFTQCMVVPVHFTQTATNIIYVCQKNKEFKERQLYTDDLNASTLDFFNLMNAIRSSHEKPSRSETRH